MYKLTFGAASLSNDANFPRAGLVQSAVGCQRTDALIHHVGVPLTLWKFLAVLLALLLRVSDVVCDEMSVAKSCLSTHCI